MIDRQHAPTADVNVVLVGNALLHDQHLCRTKPRPFDGLLAFDASDDETAAAMFLRLGALVNVQTTTARAFPATEMDKELAKMGE